MTTPAQNINRKLTVSCQQTRYRADGSVVRTQTTTRDVQAQTFVRPASKKSVVRKDGTRRPLSWNARWSRHEPPHGNVINHYGSTPGSAYGVSRGFCSQGLSYSMASTLGDQDLRNTVLRALSKATEQHMQLSAAMSQMKGTVDLARDFAREATHRLDNLMGGPKGLAKRLGRMSKWRNLPDEYLAYLYGIAPLADDVTNAFDYLYSLKDNGLECSVILKSRRSRRESTESRTVNNMPNGSGGTGIARITGLRHIETAAGFRFDLPRNLLSEKPVISPFTTAYELTKLSFVVDWFVPIGDWLGSLEAAQWSPFFVEGWTLKYVRERYNYRNLEPPVVGGTWVLDLGGRFEQGFMTRSYVSEFPHTIMSPPAINPLPGLHQAAQASALLTQAFKRWR